MPAPRVFPKPSLMFAGAAALLAFAGCASPVIPPPTLTAQSGAEAYAARSLRDPALRAFLHDHAGTESATANFDALCWTAFYYNPDLALARAEWGTARAAQRTAGQLPNPSLTLSPGYDFTRQAGVSSWLPGVSLDVPIVTGGKRAAEQAIAAADADAARLSVLQQAWQVRSTLRAALLDWEAARRSHAALEREAELQARAERLLVQRREAGAADAEQVAVVRTARLTAAAAAADAAAQVSIARTRVAAALGVPVAALDGVTLPLPPAPPASLLAPRALEVARRVALRSRSDVLAALARYRSAQAALSLAVARRLPDVHLGPGYQWDQGQNKWTLGITFELPIFHSQDAAIAEAVARREQAAAAFMVVQGHAVADVDAAEAAYRAAEQRLAQANALLAEERQAVARARQRVQLGAGDALDRATADVAAAQATATEAAARAALAAAAGRLEDALQRPFPALDTVTDLSAKTAQP